MVRLAEGLLRFPQDEAVSPLEEALPVLEMELMEEALRAKSYLAALKGEPVPEPYQGMLKELRPEAQVLFLPPSSYQSCPFPYLHALGEGRLSGAPRLGIKELELLVLLLTRREGWRGEELAEALYGEDKRTALKVAIYRLRRAGFQVDSQPYCLRTRMGADFLDLKMALEQGALDKALQLYRGPLLPKSKAPAIEELRLSLEEELKIAVLASKRKDLLYALARRLPEDLEVWELLLERLTPEDPRYTATLAQVRRLRREYNFSL